MGGYGSGRPRERTPVDECLILSAGKLQRDKAFEPGGLPFGILNWTNSVTEEKVASVGYLFDLAGGVLRMCLLYTRASTGENIECRVRLSTTPLPWGCRRWVFLCPSCRRVCRKLYLPPGCRHFACRLCYRLTYTSSQEAHKFDRFYRQLGITPAQAKAMFD